MADGLRAEVRLLGDLEITVGGLPVQVAGRNLRLLLAMLALRSPHPVRADTVAEALWGPEPDVDTTAGLQALVSRARRVLADSSASIRAVQAGYALSGVSVDAEKVRALVEDGPARAPDDAATTLRAALALWRGPALGEFADCEFIRLDAERLTELRADATESLGRALLTAGRPSEAAAVLDPHLTAHPFRERACADLMLALYRAGRCADALERFRHARELAVAQLGLEPGPELRALESRMLQQDPDLLGPTAAVRTHTTAPDLPSPSGRFFGRERELAELTSRLAEARLLTLWGPGGAGKTRLGLELARRQANTYGDGVAFAELATVTDPAQVPFPVMNALGMHAVDGDPVDALCRYLAGRESLIVLDNCEHVLDGAAAVARPLLKHCPGIQLVATSREPLGVPDEWVWPTPALGLPQGDGTSGESDAVALFVHRAHQGYPGFALDAENTAAVVEICRRLDGMPLALELAAARVRSLGVHGVAARLDDRFRLLTGNRAADPRQQTLQATVDWSYDLLSEDERAFLDCLSVFPGSFDAAAAAAVGSAAPGEADQMLAGLVDRSLVVVLPDADGVRYRLLETIREYGEARLTTFGLVATTRDRHLAHFRQRIPDWVVWFTGGPYWYLMHRERDNFRAATEWALTVPDPLEAIRLCSGLWPYWSASDNPGDTPREWLQAAVDRADLAPGRDGALALISLAWFSGDTTAISRALAYVESTDDRRLRKVVRWIAGGITSRTDPAGALRHLQSAEDGERSFVDASSQHLRAWIALSADDVKAARHHAERALDTYADLTLAASGQSMSPMEPWWRGTLALALAIDGEREAAAAQTAGALPMARAHRLPMAIALTLTRAAGAAVFSEDWPAARTYLRELLELLRTLGTQRFVGDALEFSALTVAAAGDSPLALDLLDAAEHYHQHHNETPGGGIPAVAALVAAARVSATSSSERTSPRIVPGATSLDGILAAALAALD